MSFKIVRDGTEIIVESAEEFRIVAQEMGISRIQIPMSEIVIRDDDHLNGNNPLRLVYGRLNGQQKGLIDYLASTDWAAIEPIKAATGIEGNLNLAGLWTSIIKNGQKHGVAKERLFEKKQGKANGRKRSYWYRLTPEFKEAIAQR